MAPYELTNSGGSIEHWNDESGEKWLNKIQSYFYKAAWLNPSIKIIGTIPQQ